jgi:hypothetical protein
MYSRLTMEGRGVARLTAKVVGIAVAVAFGMGEISMAGRALGDWRRHVTAASPARSVAMPSYVSAPMTTPQEIQTQSGTAQFQPIPAAEVQLTPTYNPPQIALPPVSGRVRVTNSGHRPQQSSQRRYFRYPTNFQSGFHPNSSPIGGHRSASTGRR